ncbi:multivesicular body subunit 12A [Clupea harengus]|uniref:Multivesicular body subunit 12A n=1 Tax=Clupea harengus TaxID=7950 RepID=A0A6P8EQJ2_CLUHA|nr:multivesicular body subunit 12A [Clupea harengus]
MSLRDLSGSDSRPVTAVAWASNNSTCPGTFNMISSTEDGATASFNRGFGRSGYFLCYSKDLSGSMVVSDIQVISDRTVIPHGYCFIPEFMEPKGSVLKKKRVCARMVPVGSVTTGVLEVRLTTKSKVMLQQYTCLGELHGFVLWCKKGPISGPAPQAKPRSVSLDLRKLSLEGTAPPQPLRPCNLPPAPPRISCRRNKLEEKTIGENDSSSNIYGITAIDGVPFALHPKFEAQTNNKGSANSFSNIRIKSIQDIENEYNYTFSVEEQAAQRITASAMASS